MAVSLMVRKILFSFLFFVALLVSWSSVLTSVNAQVTPTDTPTPTPDTPAAVSSLEQQIQALQSKISDLQGQEKTLSSQIAVMDNQIKLTELRIQATEQQISDLTLNIDTASQKITDLQSSVASLTKVLLNRVVATYEVGTIQPMQMLLTSSTVADFLKRLNYLKIAQAHDKKSLFDMVQAKNDYQNQKTIYENEKKQVEALKVQLDTYTTQLNQEKNQKQQLLSDTQGSEANYQQQLHNLQAQLAVLAGFANARSGGVVSIIAHQDLSDGWGKYYNQRDANWGTHTIGYSSEQVWEVGCLLTSYTMVATHFGASITPADVAANGDNFALGTAYFRIPGPSANGHSATYVTNPSMDQLKTALQNGAAIVAGLSSNGGPYPQHYSDHWVVLRGLDGSGNFMINDPWYAGAMNVSINDHYSGWTIIEARIYQ